LSKKFVHHGGYLPKYPSQIWIIVLRRHDAYEIYIHFQNLSFTLRYDTKKYGVLDSACPIKISTAGLFCL
jgi:hypothetical protein